MSHEISDEILCAHIDNELDGVERAKVIEGIATDMALRQRACELWQVKQMVRGAYPLPRSRAVKRQATGLRPNWIYALAASLLLIIGSLSGWLLHDSREDDRQLLGQIDAIRADGGRVILHLFSDEPARMEHALQTAERLAKARDRAGHPFRVEFIANGPGLHLLRDGGSPYAEQVATLHQHYSNLRIIACHDAIERLQERGISVMLLPGVEETPSAESELANRLTQGWRYVQS
jgi:intracellular sulfur oxidation DsrE/DsrF family protein